MRSLFGPRQRREPNLIDRLCHECGQWMVISSQLDAHQVRSVNRYKISHIDIRYMEGHASVIFQLYFPIRFSLENPPSGLFGRLLLRNHELHYATWVMNIVESCEAGIQVAARLPRQGIDARLFHRVCTELADEADGFGQELRDKFRYSVGGVTPGHAMQEPPRHYGTIGQSGPEVRYIEPVQQHQIGQNGRYRLPGQRGS